MRTMCAIVPVVLVFAASLHASPILGQADDFQDGTTQGWGSGPLNSTPPANVASGGPMGAGDGYLQITAIGGGGPGSKLAAFNSAQWAGDYTTAGITVVQLDAANLGGNPITLRLLLEGPGGRFYTLGAPLGAGTGWRTFVFAVDAASLAGGIDVAATRGGVTKLWVFNNPSPAFPGPSIVATFGIDNLSALGGPPTAGDADLDGDVDLDDFVILKNNFSTGTTWGQGDFDLNGTVDLDDFVILKSNFGAAAVPEPATLSLLAIASLPLLRRRRQ